MSGCWISDRGGDAGDLCNRNDDCGGDLICAGTTCQEPGSLGPGAPCSANRDCQDDLHCSIAGRCASAGSGAEGDSCFSSAECQRDLVCQLVGFGGVCQPPGDGDIGASCSSNLDCIAGLLCGQDDTCQGPATAFPPYQGVSCEPDEEIFKAYFQLPRPSQPPLDFFRTPFPSDVRVDDAGNLDLADFPVPGKNFSGVDIVALYRDAVVAEFQGFSTQAAVAMRFSSELDWGSVDPGQGGTPPKLVDISDPASPRTLGTGFGYRTDRRLYHCQHFFTVRSSEPAPLEPGTYAVYLTTDIRSADGEAPAIDSDLSAVLGDTRPDDAALGAAWDRHAPFRQYLQASSEVSAADIATVAVFTVQDARSRAAAVATATEASAAPVLSDLTLCGTGVTGPCEAEGARACTVAADDPDMREIHGRFSVPIFQEGTPPYLETGGGVPAQPVVVDTQDVCFALTIPSAASGPTPLVVYGHGTGGTMTGAVENGVARALATAATPMATLSFDGVVHGDRRGGADLGPDTLMFNVFNPPAAVGNHLQGGADVIQAMRIAEQGTIEAGDVSVELDPANVFFFGHSQGSNVGIPAVATSSRPSATVLSGAGGFLVLGLLNKTSPLDVRAGLELLVGEELVASHPVMMLWQTYFDPVDTSNFGPLLHRAPPDDVAAKHVLMTWGQGDSYSPGPSLNAMAESAFLDAVLATGQDTLFEAGNEPRYTVLPRPVSGNAVDPEDSPVTAAVLQYQPDGYDGHFVAQRDPQAIADWVAFLVSAVDGATPTIP